MFVSQRKSMLPLLIAIIIFGLSISIISIASAEANIIPTGAYTAECAVEPYTTVQNITSSQKPEKAIDGLITDASRWAYFSADGPYAAGSTTTKYVTYDLGAPTAFDQVSFYMDRINPSNLGYYTVNCSLQYSDILDDSLLNQSPTIMNLTTNAANDITDGTKVIQKFTAPIFSANITARYVRFAFTYYTEVAQTGLPCPVEISLNLNDDYMPFIPLNLIGSYTTSCANSLYTTQTGLASGCDPSKALDGNISHASRWAYDNRIVVTTTGLPQRRFLTIDLGSIKSFNTLSIFLENELTFNTTLSLQYADVLGKELVYQTPMPVTLYRNSADNFLNGTYTIQRLTAMRFDKNITARYVRFNFTYANTGNPSQPTPVQQTSIPYINEISLGLVTSTVIPSGNSATPSLTQVEPYSSIEGMAGGGHAYKATDGVLSNQSCWSYFSTTTKGTKYVTYDLKESRQFNKMSFYCVLPADQTVTLTYQYGDSLDSSLLAQAPMICTLFTNKAYNMIDPVGNVVLQKFTTPKFSTITARFVRFAFTYKNGTTIDTNPRIIEIYLGLDDDIVLSAQAQLTIGLGNSVDLNNVANNLTLPTTMVGAGEGATISWVSNNPAVDASGIVTRPTDGVNATGDLIATISKEGNTSLTKTFSVVVLASSSSVSGVSLNKSTTTISQGETETLLATVSPDDAINKIVMWMSSDENIAMVDSNGIVTAVACGVASVTAITFEGGYMAICEVTVVGTQGVDKVELQIAITNATTLINSTPVGTINGNVPQSAKDTFQTAIDTASTVNIDVNATQAQVDAQLDALALATISFNNAIISDILKYNVTGTVSLITGADLTKISIIAKQLDVTTQTVSVLADGTFTISLEPGIYTISVSRPGYLAKKFTNFTVTTENSQTLSATAISLTSGDVVTTDQNTIDLQDLQRILSNFGLTRSDLTFNTVYDLNDDGAINLIDLQAVLKNFGSVQ